MENMNRQELISALADGHLQGEQFAQAVAAASFDKEALQSWDAYHLIGDVLRSGERASCRASLSTLDRVRAELAREAPLQVAAAEVAVVASSPQAANDDVFRWKMVAGFATAASVALVAWNFVPGSSRPASTELASASPAASAQPVMMRDPRLDDFLAAHRQYAGATALHKPAVFLRNATFEQPAR